MYIFKDVARVSIFVSQVHYNGHIANPSIGSQQVAKPNKKPGRPKLPSSEKKRSSGYDEASKLASSSTLDTLMKATGIKARREKLPDSAHILRALQKGPEKSASHYRKASIAYKKRCKYLNSTKNIQKCLIRIFPCEASQI